jgi:hypothetical protein
MLEKGLFGGQQINDQYGQQQTQRKAHRSGAASMSYSHMK